MFRQIQTAERRCDRCESIVFGDAAGNENNLPIGWMRFWSNFHNVELCTSCKLSLDCFLQNKITRPAAKRPEET